ncbi:Zn(II)2Cys6 transcription factor [Aspergillus mulundensis]|uniref:Zn(2)-C6 fungal-type domain-containing protein n=1 Tax=Aspergillus mulundensis TaxID=1810919 RepID=A0A3D8SBL6_9EURO|nr:hypothetical protein DSM5745_03989 [Aspergillus mulundensis]RDW83663.1 hypothetical protein DSM5745_03989 [Aspergillus mulundensis]
MALACEKCRGLKVKCVRVVEGQPCVKCTKTKSQCIIREPRQRVRQSRAKPRLAELESKITDLLGLLSQPNEANSVEENVMIADDGRFTSPVQPAGIDQGQLDAEYPTPDDTDLDFVQMLDSTTGKDSAMTWSTPTSTDSSWVTDLGLSMTALDQLLDDFRGMASYFPFVVIPSGWTAASMAEDRPFLLLSAVASASSTYSNLQRALVEELKGILSHRVVMAGEKDLDLLQGLLVHLAWFHFYLDPRSQQTYQYLQLAIGMVVDLRLDKKIADLMENDAIPSDLDSHEICRAYLGCYYLSSTMATATSKPDNFSFSEHILSCARMLQQDHKFPTDDLMYPTIKLQQFTWEVRDTYQLGSIATNWSHPDRFMARLQEWWSTLSEDTQRAVSGYRAAKIRIYEMGLVYRYGQRKRAPANVSTQPTAPARSTVNHNLIQSLICAKEYLDAFLVMTQREYNKLPLSAWYQLILAIIVLYRLSVGLPDYPNWDREIAQDTVKLETYLDMLSQRLRPTEFQVGTGARAESNKCLFIMFPDMVESVKVSYMAARAQPIPDNYETAAHEAFVSGDTMPSARKHRCPGMRNLRRLTGETTEEDTLLQSAIADEVQQIENEKFWNDLIVADISN